MQEIVFKKNEIKQIALQLVQLPVKIFCLSAAMGCGKTTIIKAMAAHLGVDEQSMSSPTFAIVNEYLGHNKSKIYHIDAYRIQHAHELMQIGIESYISGDHYCFIEWPDLIVNLLDTTYAMITIQRIDKNTRRIQCQLH